MKKILYKMVILLVSFVGGFLVTKSSVHWPLNGLSISPNIYWCRDPSGLPFAFVGTLKGDSAPGQPIIGCAGPEGILLTITFFLDIIFWAALICVAIWLFSKVFKLGLNEK